MRFDTKCDMAFVTVIRKIPDRKLIILFMPLNTSIYLEGINEMPDGKTHEMINAAVLMVAISVLTYLATLRGPVAFASYLNTYTILVFAVAYLFATFFLSPDLDINSKPYRRWGIFKILWWPYKVIFKHRGFSHNLILGPLSIVVNLALIVVPLLLLAGVKMQNLPIDYVLAAIAGMVLSMEVHIISDSFVSRMKDVF
ncbi:metal-binding protein [Methanolobus sp. ZRKC2]|uniref:metal-binding protein n=1 Tax=Methanolobus sp. ZRKC2 TaxID=3125783 RepID=UPI003243CC37